MSLKKILFVAMIWASILFSGNACADETSAESVPRELFVVLSAGLTYGGDVIETAKFTDGATQDIRAGNLVQIGAGLEWRPPAQPWSGRLMLNYQTDSAAGSNGKLRLSRIPIELVGHYHVNDRIFVGGGARLVTVIRYKHTIDNDPLNSTAKFDPAAGAVVEIGYRFGQPAQLVLRYVAEKYKTPGSAAIKPGTYDASHAGIFINLLF